MTAVVTCGHTRTGLAAVRALGIHGDAVAVGAPVRPALALWSRFASSTFLVPHAALRPAAFAAEVLEQVAGRQATLILVGTDAALLALNRVREKLPPVALRVFPPRESLARVLDRSALFDLARSIGIPCVDALRITDESLVEKALQHAAAAGFPCLVREDPSLVERAAGLAPLATPRFFRRRGALRDYLLAEPTRLRNGLSVEPRPPATTFGYGAVCAGGEPLLEVYEQRRGGLVETQPAEPEVRDLVRRLVAALTWQGPIYVSLRRGRRDGLLRLASVAGRLWPTAGLARLAGADPVMACAKLSVGQPPTGGRVARPFVRTRSLADELLAMRGVAPFEPSETRGRRFWQALDPRRVGASERDTRDAWDPLPLLYGLRDASLPDDAVL